MSVNVTLPELQQQLPELLERTVASGEECVVQRNGEDFAVIVSVRQWKRRTTGKQLDQLGPAYRLSRVKQSRTEELLTEKQRRALTSAEHLELKSLLRESDAIMRRRAKALSRRP